MKPIPSVRTVIEVPLNHIKSSRRNKLLNKRQYYDLCRQSVLNVLAIHAFQE